MNQPYSLKNCSIWDQGWVEGAHIKLPLTRSKFVSSESCILHRACDLMQSQKTNFSINMHTFFSYSYWKRLFELQSRCEKKNMTEAGIYVDVLLSLTLSLALFFFIRTHHFPFTVGDVPNGFAETDLADRIEPLVASVWCPFVCAQVPVASAELFVSSSQRRQAAPDAPRRLHNSARAKGTPTMIEHNDVWSH